MEPQSIWTNDSPRLHLVSWEGTGPPLLLAHGMAANTHWWDAAAPLLTASFKPVALDFHGHGDSEWRPDGRYDTAGFIDDIETARHALGWDKMILAGHSLGGRVALEYAKTQPTRLAGLILIDFLPEFYESKERKFSRTRTRPQPLYHDAQAMARNFHLQPPGTLLNDEQVRALGRQSLKKVQNGSFTWKFDWRAFLYDYGSMWPLMPEVRAPTLVIRGGKSTVMNHEAYERAVRSIPGAKGVEIPKAHHHVPLDSPKELAEQIARLASCL